MDVYQPWLSGQKPNNQSINTEKEDRVKIYIPYRNMAKIN